jgi:hypothetical protein
MSLSEALEPLVPTAVHALFADLEHGRTHGRGALAYMVRVLPLINREARDRWRKEPNVAIVLTVCAYLYNSGHRDRYLDGVLFDHEAEALATQYQAFEPKPKGILDLTTIHIRRKETSEKLQATPSLFAHACPGMQLPLPTQFYLSIWQMHSAFRRHPRYSLHFAECQRVGCHRPALIETPGSGAADSDDDDDESSEAEYWKCCRDGKSPRPTSSLPSDMIFCCHGCYKIANSEFKRLVKFDIETPSTSSRLGGPTTPTQLYRAAIKRNLSIARQLRNQPQVETRHYPSTMANREQMVREQTMVLSVDLGLLFAASIIHQMPASRRPNRPLPCTEDWRDSASCFFGAVERVRDFYLAYGKGLLARDGTELWLRRLNDQVLDVF